MTDLQVRRPRFDFTGDIPFVWNPERPAFSLAMNATSILAIGFEQMIVAAVREGMPRISDPAIAEEATAFLKQEAQHSSSHRKHVMALIRRHPGLQQVFDDAMSYFDDLTPSTSLEFRLAYVADLEATFTPSFKLMLDNDDILFRPGDDRVASLFLWHFVEEVEHRSSALVIYDAVVGKPWYRMRVLPRVVKHMLGGLELIADGVNAHLPFEDRRVDARSLLPSYGFEHAVKRLRGRSEPKAPPPFQGVPLREKVVAGVRVLLSQTPFHDPAEDRLPAFADDWFRRWDDGGDVTRWYGAAVAG